MKKYISKGEWFDKGSEVELIGDCGSFGLFCGYRNGKLDEETCSWNEFEILEGEENGRRSS